MMTKGVAFSQAVRGILDEQPGNVSGGHGASSVKPAAAPSSAPLLNRLSNFYSGSSVYLGLAWKEAITQTTFTAAKTFLLERKGLPPSASLTPAWLSFLVAAACNSIARTLTYPLFAALVTIKTGKARPGQGVLATVATLYGEHGLSGMYAGCLPELLRGVCFQGIVMSLVEALSARARAAAAVD
jgi:hypothetical protein